MRQLLLCTICTIVTICHAFVPHQRPQYGERVLLHLKPLSQVEPPLQFLKSISSSSTSPSSGPFDSNGIFVADNNDQYTLSVMQESDVPDTAKFVVNAFGADIISLSQDLSTLERAVLEPSVGLMNAYSGLVAYAEVFSGMQLRTKDRNEYNDIIAAPKLLLDDNNNSYEDSLKRAEQSSLVFNLAKRSSPNQPDDWHIDIIASVELRLQPTDAKIPFSFPLLDRLERKLATTFGNAPRSSKKKLQPYLCNLCVDSNYRRKRLGKALVQCVEDVCANVWDYDVLYLHLDLDNEAALRLYEKEGYRDVGKRWKPFWAGEASKIGYFCKTLK